MPAYKNDYGSGWVCKFRWYDWKGKAKYVTKRGFATKREAQEYEINFKASKSNSSSMRFKEFVNEYLEAVSPRLKESTLTTKKNIINTHIIPYFGEMKTDEITSLDVMKWQNELMGKYNFTKTYLKTINNQLVCIFNFGVKYYQFKTNPAKQAGSIGSSKRSNIDFWTLEEYQKFAETMMDKPIAYYAFEVLYWTGIREGELLALTLDDIDFEKKTININKTYHHINGHDLITSPKTERSNRVVTMPQNLVDEMKDYVKMIYGLEPTDRLFPMQKTYLYKYMDYGIKNSGVKKIRVHDLRHSHVSLLINMGYSAVAIAERVGHESIEITYRYAHLFPSEKESIAADLDKKMEKMTNEQ